MNRNNKKLQKTSQIVSIVVRIVQIILLLTILTNIYFGAGATNTEDQYGVGDPITSTIANASIAVIVLIALFIISSFLKSLRQDYTPITDKNIKRLKTVAILVMIIEPVVMGINSIGNMLRPIDESGMKVQVYSYMGGMVFVLGLIIFCIAIVFGYGCHLQKQSDETL